MHLIVGIDGASASDRALDHAATIAAATGGRLTLVHAADPEIYNLRDGSGPITDRSEAEQRLVIEEIEDAEERGDRLLETAIARLDDEITDEIESVDTSLLYGDPVGSIATYATDQHADGIVVGHRRLSDAHERLLGSVAKGLVERATVPVTVVR